jgi:hypothetical protein
LSISVSVPIQRKELPRAWAPANVASTHF